MISPSAVDNSSMKARSKSYNLGYMSGSVDLIVLHKNRKLKTVGMAIEFKSPSGMGTLSKKQATFINQIAKQAFFIIIGNDYDDIIRQIIDYMR
jgi:cobalamin biosynthesis Co2+ chelatase CbiK